jgi:hypothetical protein
MGLFKSIASAIEYVNETVNEASAYVTKEYPTVVGLYDDATKFISETYDETTKYVSETYTEYVAPTVDKAVAATSEYCNETMNEVGSFFDESVNPVVSKAVDVTLEYVDEKCESVNKSMVETLVKYPHIATAITSETVVKLVVANNTEKMMNGVKSQGAANVVVNKGIAIETPMPKVTEAMCCKQCKVETKSLIDGFCDACEAQVAACVVLIEEMQAKYVSEQLIMQLV